MTVQDLEQQLLQLSPVEKLHIIQLLAQSLNTAVAEQQTTITNSVGPKYNVYTAVGQSPNTDVAGQQTTSSGKLSVFFHESPLAEAVAAEGLNLERDRRLPEDRFVP